MGCLDISHRFEVISAYQTLLYAFFTKQHAFSGALWHPWVVPQISAKLKHPPFRKFCTSLIKCINTLSTYFASNSAQKMQNIIRRSLLGLGYSRINKRMQLCATPQVWLTFVLYTFPDRCTLSINTLRKHLNANALIRDVWFISVECGDEVVFIVPWH